MKIKRLMTFLAIMGILVDPFPSTVMATDYLLPDGSTLKLGIRCPVCGMTVGGELEAPAIYAYTNGSLTGFGGVAAAVFNDGKVVGFDDAWCLFSYNKIPRRYGIDVRLIKHRFVTDFHTKKLINAGNAFMVTGTKVRGFMGYALVPFSSNEQAEKFRREHGGKSIIRLQKVSPKQVN
ncbi:nitrous oxide reductase accessory protein NosL [Thermodesulfobacteriota bacterium]